MQSIHLPSLEWANHAKGRLHTFAAFCEVLHVVLPIVELMMQANEGQGLRSKHTRAYAAKPGLFYFEKLTTGRSCVLRFIY